MGGSVVGLQLSRAAELGGCSRVFYCVVMPPMGMELRGGRGYAVGGGPQQAALVNKQRGCCVVGFSERTAEGRKGRSGAWPTWVWRTLLLDRIPATSLHTCSCCMAHLPGG